MCAASSPKTAPNWIGSPNVSSKRKSLKAKKWNRLSRTRAASSPPADPLFRGARGRVWIMGVLNATPDSFYAGSRGETLARGLARAELLVQEGADVLDLGGEST